MREDDEVSLLIINEQLNRLIFRRCRKVATEQRQPTLAPDESDAEIAEGKLVIKGLRECRNGIEELMTGVML